MLWHYRKRADECASRIANAKSEAIRQNYERLLESWQALIVAEEARLNRLAAAPQKASAGTRSERPHLQLVRTPPALAPIVDRPLT